MDQLNPFPHSMNCRQRCKESRSPPLEGLAKQRSLDYRSPLLSLKPLRLLCLIGATERALMPFWTVRLIQLTTLYISLIMAGALGKIVASTS